MLEPNLNVPSARWSSVPKLRCIARVGSQHLDVMPTFTLCVERDAEETSNAISLQRCWRCVAAMETRRLSHDRETLSQTPVQVSFQECIRMGISQVFKCFRFFLSRMSARTRHNGHMHWCVRCRLRVCDLRIQTSSAPNRPETQH